MIPNVPCSLSKNLHSNVIPFNTSITALTVNTKQLAELLNCGRPTAVKVGIAAGARVTIGERKILWNLKAIQRYLDTVSQ